MDQQKKEQLCRDLLAESTPGGFEEAVFARTLGAVRTRRRLRAANRTAAAAAIVLAALLLSPLQERTTPVPVAESIAEPRVFELVRTEPAFALEPEPAALPLLHIQTRPAILAVVRTGDLPGPSFMPISDQQLLALFEGEPVAIYRSAPHNATLLLLDETTRGVPRALR